MYAVIFGKKYKKSVRKIVRGGRIDKDSVETVVELLHSGKLLPQKYQNHFLSGELQGYQECHIRGDLLLVYEKDEENKLILLHNIGSHSELFG